MPLPPAEPLARGTVRAFLAGFAAVGLDAPAVARAAGFVDPADLPYDAPVPGAVFSALWEEAFVRAPRETLPTEVGLAVPFGAFGPVDYLAASSARVDLAFGAIASFFKYIASDFRIVVEEEPGGGGLVAVRVPEPFPGWEVSDEFTVAVLVSRFRRAAAGAFSPRVVRLTRPAPATATRHAELLGCPVRFGAAESGFDVRTEAWRAPMHNADPALERTVRELAAHLGLGATTGDLETALRARLRHLLPQGEVSASAAAAALGLSERTLQRRLAAAGTSYREVLDRLRETEAERLLGAGRLPLGEVALRLGFSDQTAWNRAFRRWKGVSPTEWRAGTRAAAEPPG